MRVAIIERDEKVLEELKKGLKRVDPNYELAGIAISSGGSMKK